MLNQKTFHLILKNKRRLVIPNTKAKDRKRNKRLLNKKLAKEGRTATQVKRFKKKEKDNALKNYSGGYNK